MVFLRTSIASDTAPTLYGKKVYLRSPQASDYPQWADIRSQSRAFLTPWEPSWSRDELTRSSFRRRIKHYQRDVRDDKGYAFFLFRICDTALSGGLTLSNVRRGVTQSCVLGYWIGEPYANQGYMTDAVRAVAPFVFETLGLHRLEAACLLNNTPSIRLLENIGFRREGVARSYLRINNEWRDHYLYALLAEDLKLV